MVHFRRFARFCTFERDSDIYPQKVEKHYVDVSVMIDVVADSQHLRANTIDNIHTVLHQVLELGVEDEYLRTNPSDNALRELKRAHNNDSEKRRALTIPEQELFENYLSGEGQYQRWYPIFTVMMWTGMRVGEITGLRWCDIAFEDETINVNHTLVYFRKGVHKRCDFAVNTPKTKAGGRIIPMLPKVKEAFLMEKEYQVLVPTDFVQ
jgi:integrase